MESLEKNVVMQLIVLYAKGWVFRDSEFTYLRYLLCKYGYWWDTMTKTELYNILILKFSEVQQAMYANGFNGNIISTSYFMGEIENRLSWDSKLDRVDATIYVLLSIFSQIGYKLARPDFKELGMGNYSQYKCGMTYTEMNRILSKYKWVYEMEIINRTINIKPIKKY